MQCSLDLVPTWILKKITGDVSNFLVDIFNRSFSNGQVPRHLKPAIVTPLLKKDGPDLDDLHNFRQIANVSLIWKIFERQVKEHINVIGALQHVLSAYRHYHSTETALTKIFSDIIMAADAEDVSVLALLDLISTFDIVYHTILFNHLCSGHHMVLYAIGSKITCEIDVSPWCMLVYSHHWFYLNMVCCRVSFWDHRYSSCTLQRSTHSQ